MNHTTGASSTAAKFASVFALADNLLNSDSTFRKYDKRKSYYDKAIDALAFAIKKPGVTQTVSVRSPYIYAEDNWVDDMELAYASIQNMIVSKGKSNANGWHMVQSLAYAKKEKVTPWLGSDTAHHYQWYPFINLGHYELAKQLRLSRLLPLAGYTSDFIKSLPLNGDTVTGYYRTGIERVWNKVRSNAFYRGIPFIWCSNNLTTAFTIQCYWYKQLTGDKTFDELAQANFDWLFGCNPWGTSMVYGLPTRGDTPVDPHSAFTHLKNYQINGGLVDGPVYTSIYKNLIGITLKDADEYTAFQSDLAVYHDDYGDYSTNEPTMDGTASLIYLLAARESEANLAKDSKDRVYDPAAISIEKLKTIPAVNMKQALEGKIKSRPPENHGAIIRGDTTKQNLAIVLTGDEFADGGNIILKTLQKQKVKASFFFTGRFYRNPAFNSLTKKIKLQGHYLGPHSDQHLLYCDWAKRDSLLITKQQFISDLEKNINAIEQFGVKRPAIQYFIPPYEWYNDSIAAWTKALGMQLINYSPGTLSTADYTYPPLPNYKSSDEIYASIIKKEKADAQGLNGFILLIHIGTDPRRTDKFYIRLDELITGLKRKQYKFVSLETLLK